MDYMTEIAAAVMPLLDGGPEVRPEAGVAARLIERALKAELGWSRFLDRWQGGTIHSRCELLADLLYQRPAIAADLVRKLLAGRYPSLLSQIARQVRASGPGPQLDRYRNLPEEDLLRTLLLSPEHVLTLAEKLSVPVPLRTAERVLSAAARKAKPSDGSKLPGLMSRLARLKEQLELVGRALDRISGAPSRRGYAAYRKAVDREVERTEASMRRLERLLAGLRTSVPRAIALPRRQFYQGCRRHCRA